MASAFPVPTVRVLRQPARDVAFIGLSVAHAVLLVAWTTIPLVAIGLWWNANTIAHNFIHRPFFRSHAANRGYSAYLSIVLGVPQSLWRRRHLVHHAETRLPWAQGERGQIAYEAALVLAMWSVLITIAPELFFLTYLPGWAIGLALCQIHGHYEHAHGTTSHYGRVYNFLFFNDGYHVEHHARPGADWLALPLEPAAGNPSRWPAVLRWLELFSLEGLERLVLSSPRLQRFVVRAHERAFRRLLGNRQLPRVVTIVGGGMFPRTAIVVRRMAPAAAITIVEVDREHLAVAQPFLAADVRVRHELFDPASPVDADLAVVPLAFIGDRKALYDRPPAPLVLVHDWIWRPRGESCVISWLLLKRLNLVRPRT